MTGAIEINSFASLSDSAAAAALRGGSPSGTKCSRGHRGTSFRVAEEPDISEAWQCHF